MRLDAHTRNMNDALNEGITIPIYKLFYTMVTTTQYTHSDHTCLPQQTIVVL